MHRRPVGWQLRWRFRWWLPGRHTGRWWLGSPGPSGGRRAAAPAPAPVQPQPSPQVPAAPVAPAPVQALSPVAAPSARPVQAVAPEDDIPEEDDPDLNEEAFSGQELIIRELGATVLEEIHHRGN